MTTLGKYELHEQLGRGGFGTVYRATDTDLDRVVALKILHPQLTTDPDFLNRFRNEARLVASLDSPHIVTIYDMGEIEGRVYISMKYLSGGSLGDMISKSGALPFSKAQQVMQEVCTGLSAAHKKGLVHRDIKPSNILFDGEGRAVIGDFGLARAVHLSSSTATSSTGAVGTPAYRAPELWLGKPPASPATDIYSLGCVLSEMLTGKVLFDGDTTEEILTRHLITGPNIPDQYPAGTPPEIRSVILNMVTKDTSDRYQDAISILETIKAFSPGNAVPAATPRPVPPPPAQRSRPAPQVSHQPQPRIAPAQVKPAPKSGSGWTSLVFAIIGLIAFFITGYFTSWFGLKDSYTPPPYAPPADSVANSPATEAPVNNPPVNSVTDTPVVIVVTSAPPDEPVVQESSFSGMEYISGGTFNMGATDAEMRWHRTSCSYYLKKDCGDGDYKDMQPQHTVKISPYYMDLHEVTNTEYKKCVESGGCSQPSNQMEVSFHKDFYPNDYFEAHHENYPVVGVNWNDAVTYCKWNGNKRLPTEAEWEFAAAGGDEHWFFPWLKNTPSGASASDVFEGKSLLSNFCDNKCTNEISWKDKYQDDGYEGAAPVMSFPVGIFGLYDMSGNVSEWVQDYYTEDFYAKAGYDNPTNKTPNPKGKRVTRGGGWNNGIYGSSSFLRWAHIASDEKPFLGFRCAKDAY